MVRWLRIHLVMPAQGTKIAHGLEQLSQSAETIEPKCHN